MAESNEGDAENPNHSSAATSNQDYNAADVFYKKRKIIALSVLVVATVALAIVLLRGETVGTGGDSVGIISSQNKNTNNSSDGMNINRTNDATAKKTTIDTTTRGSNDIPFIPIEPIESTAPTEPTGGSTVISTPPTQLVTEDSINTPQVFRVQYLQSNNGPIESRVRIANPGIADGYNSCADLKGDILNAIKYYMNSFIVSERDIGSVQMCDIGDSCSRDGVCQSYNCTEGKCVPGVWNPGSPSHAPTWEATPTVGYEHEGEGGLGLAPVLEDDFDTNTQVEGVDEADVIKANVNYTFAAYGDVLWAWNSTDASKGRMSMTHMTPGPIHPDCNAVFPTRPPQARTRQHDNDDMLIRMRNLRQRKAFLPDDDWYGRCNSQKPRVVSLLLAGPRLTAIVSQRDYLSDSNDKIVIRVYDAENVPTGGGPLTLLGEQEIKGAYTSARSIGSKAIIISELNIDTWKFVRDLPRYNRQYCGLNDTEYEKVAAETTLPVVESFMEELVDELALQLDDDGTCNNFFQIAAMQSGNGTDAKNGNLLGQLVQVSSFDMSAAFSSVGIEGEIPRVRVDVAGAFASGYSRMVYASQDFAASVNVGWEYDPSKGDWHSATFIQGFDISGATPKPLSYAELSGEPINQYSLDYYQNHLRVVTTQSTWWPERKTTNKLWVLEVPERSPGVDVTNPKMGLVGETENLGKPGEEVFAVRFMGDEAHVVTFEQTDPLYVLNVSDPTNPRVTGELQIPGFSSYLHPIQIEGVNMMIGVGRHVDPRTGSNDGAKISLFDVSDPTNPTENATYIDLGAYSSADNDFYSFRYLNLNQKLILPKRKYTRRPEGNFDGFIVYDIRLGNITPSYEIEHANSNDIYFGCWYNARMPARSLVFQSQLTTILSHSVISTDLGTGVQNWNMSLDNGIDQMECGGYFYW
eukprot:CAMPEP_0196131514 /NCGR_PEP_ID=MMETSP0910-20130528/1486_1 /TAXON_ID=49265 /ORGANISM="Thalassiosira rotula, Strain GSO102" /LENGTH=919 /DNA_ID=CAMNT_0041390991 /DNA_START=228 /DNA_END=2987 /DNA_ORIENTATION=-